MQVFRKDELIEYGKLVDSLLNDMMKKTILITGGTGFIGSALVRFLLFLNNEKNLSNHIMLCVRNRSKAKGLFGNEVELVDWNVEKELLIDGEIDYVVHAACPTESKYMVDNPVDVIKASLVGTLNILELAKRKKATLLYLSSMELYGTVMEEGSLKEDSLGYIDPLKPRNCYPESKRMCEAMVSAYVNQYDLDAKSIRLAQVIGPGISYDNSKVFVMMAKAAMNNEKIKLMTKGESKHSYIYVLDAITAMLEVLIFGQKGRSYNACNPSTYCSIYEMGKLVSETFGGNECNVEVTSDNPAFFPETSYINMDCTSIFSLGWKPQKDLTEMYAQLIRYLKDIKKAQELEI